MYRFDLSPLFWAGGAFLGGIVGTAVAALAWAFWPLGWWTFAIIAMFALVGAFLAHGHAK